MSAIVFLSRNGYRLRAKVDESEAIVLGVANGSVGRDEFVDWIRAHIVKRRAR